MPAVNRKKSELDSEDGSTTWWRGVQHRNRDRFDSSVQYREFGRSAYGPNQERGGIDAGRRDTRRINATACNGCVLRLFLGTAVMVADILRDIAEAYQGGNGRDGNKDQCRCDPEFGFTRHANVIFAFILVYGCDCNHITGSVLYNIESERRSL